MSRNDLAAVTTTAALLLLTLTGAAAPKPTPPPSPAPDQAADRRAILAHIRSIFQAYVDRDRETIASTHSADWTGFQGPSTKIERSRADYMVNAERSLAAFHGTGYELLDTEVQLYGDLALVYYVARYDYLDAGGATGSIGLRALDVYRREDGDWIQCGSHITSLPKGGAWGEGR